MKQLSLFLILVWSSGLLYAQKEMPHSLSLSGQLLDFVDSGFQVGYQLPLKSWVKTRQKGKTPKVKEKFVLGGLQVGYYHEIYSHQGLVVSPQITLRRIKPKKGKLFDVKIGVGLQLSLYDAKVYTVTENNEVRQDGSSGQSAFFSSLSFAWGRDLRYRKQIPLAWSMGLGVSSRYPVNKTIVPMPFLQAGITYFLNPENVD